MTPSGSGRFPPLRLAVESANVTRRGTLVWGSRFFRTRGRRSSPRVRSSPHCRYSSGAHRGSAVSLHPFVLLHSRGADHGTCSRLRPHCARGTIRGCMTSTYVCATCRCDMQRVSSIADALAHVAGPRSYEEWAKDRPRVVGCAHVSEQCQVRKLMFASHNDSLVSKTSDPPHHERSRIVTSTFADEGRACKMP